MKMRALLGTALLATGLLFTACGGDTTEETPATDTTVTTPAPTPTPAPTTPDTTTTTTPGTMDTTASDTAK